MPIFDEDVVVQGTVSAVDGNDDATVVLDPTEASAVVGADGHAGEVRVVAQNGNAVAHLRAEDTDAGHLRLHNANDQETIHANAQDANLRVGGNGTPGHLFARNSEHRRVAWIGAGADTDAGHVRLHNADNQETIHANAQDANLRVGGNGKTGSVFARNSNFQPVAWIGAGTATEAGHVLLNTADGQQTVHINARDANLRVGGNGTPGHLFARNAEHTSVAWIGAGSSTQAGHVMLNTAAGQQTVHVNAQDANLRVGGNGTPGHLFARNSRHTSVAWLGANRDTEGGHLYLHNARGENTVHANAQDGNVRVGGNGVPGYLFARNTNFESVAWLGVNASTNAGHVYLQSARGGDATVHLNGAEGTMRAGGAGFDGRVLVRNAAGQIVVSLEGGSGDVRLFGADCAENFHADEDDELEPGMVVVSAGGERVVPCDAAYDRRAVGVIAGAGDYRPGIRMAAREDERGQVPVALLGRVFCRVDADHGGIQVGDLLTTSPTTGHAMRAEDPHRAFGAVLGKALGALSSGRGLVPVLVALQ